MKRFLFLLALCALASPAWAVAFTPSTADLMSFQPLGAFTNEASYSGFNVYTSPGVAYGSPILQGTVGYHATDVGGVGSLEYVGVGKEHMNLTGFDAFGLIVCNDNNQDWVYKLFASDGSITNESGAWTPVDSGNQQAFSVSLAGLSGLSDVTIGFQVGRSDQPDNFHTSLSPVPAPGAVLLGGIGIGLVGWLRRRQAL